MVVCIGDSFSAVGPVRPSVGTPDRAASVGTNRSPAIVLTPRAGPPRLDAWAGEWSQIIACFGQTGL